jgi:GNAT superfamily N-acetyltransferase
MTLLLPADNPIALPATRDFRVRQPQPSDRAAIEAMYARCSPASRYKRFHGGVPTLPARYLDATVAGIAHAHDALVAVSSGPVGTVHALASAAPTGEPLTIEVGTLVEDAWQRRCVGRLLLDGLLGRAARRGMCFARFEVLYENGWLADALAARLEVVDVRWDTGELSVLCRLPSA